MGGRLVTILVLTSLLSAVGCTEPVPPRKPDPPKQTLTLATTTSTRDSGLLDAILPAFHDQTGIQTFLFAIGSGQALEFGRRGDADVLLTHSPAAEIQFVLDGFSDKRVPVFYNDFVLIGPPNGPFHEKPPTSLDDALRTIEADNMIFISRGDDSGTHRKEQELWDSAGITPEFSNYLSAGSGMAQTLRIAEEKQAYTLTDRSTFLVLHSELNLEVIVEKDSRMLNHYSVMAIDADRHPHVKAENAQKFVDFLQQESTRQMIREFGRKEYGQPLFFVE
ncbi:MAG: substrate-binding domain-containing protein [Planctomyces sp.]|nr:substrate-binding domain-containing protein [Planctomyces sp.]